MYLYHKQLLVEVSESSGRNYFLVIQPFTQRQMTIKNHSQDDNGAEKLVAGSELLPLPHLVARPSLGRRQNFNCTG